VAAPAIVDWKFLCSGSPYWRILPRLRKRMAKYKAVRKKQDLPPQMRPGVPCLVIIVFVMILIVVAMYFAMKNAG